MNQFNDTTINGDLFLYKDEIETNVKEALIEIEEKINTIENNFLERTFPIGSYYITHDSTSPASLFGGTWTRIAGYFPYAEGDSTLLGQTGGSATMSFYHKHYSPFGYDETQYYATNLWGTNVINTSGYYFRDVPGGSAAPVRVNKTSEPLDDNNNSMNSKSIMPPYIRVAIWRRTA